MKRHQLNIHAHLRPELLERVLRTIRHRGFQLEAINMAPQPDCQEQLITVTVGSERPIQLLQSQLVKLIDVTHVETRELALAQPAAFHQIRV